jgi:calcium-translocating P-type ATPase
VQDGSFREVDRQTMRIQHLTIEEALRSLRSGPEGLTVAEADRRLRQFGPNQVARHRGRSLVRSFLQEFTHFFAILLWIAAALAFWADHEDPGQGMATLGYGIIGVIVVNSLFSFWQIHRAEKTLAALEKLLPHRVRVLRGGSFLELPVAVLVPGDVIALEAGDLIPADCRLIEAFGVRVSNASMTGESVPLGRDAAPCGQDDVLHSRNIILAGTTLITGDARAVVFATGMHTEFGKIAHLTQATRDVSFPLQLEIAFVSRVVAVLSLALGLVFFAVGRAIGLPFWANFLFAIGIIVANVPEGLLPTVTLALAMGAQRLARRHVLVRHLPAVETLGSTTVICTDKTGTLTENRMQARMLFLGGAFHDLTDTPSEPTLSQAYRPFFEGARLCQNLKAVGPPAAARYLGDPTEVALVEMATRMLPEALDYPRRDEVPFDSERMRFSTLHETPRGPILYTKGALEAILPLCDRVKIGSVVQPLAPEWHERFLQAQGRLADGGLRVLALAYRDVPAGEDRARLERGLILAGLVGLDDPPRPEVPAAIVQCRDAGIRVIMITGDHPQTALAVARQIGLVRTEDAVVLTGEQLSHLTDTQLQFVLDAPELLFARVAPDQKMRIVDVLKRRREVVAVTGDGVNDAPALKRADIGVAMGISGTDVAREAADMVLADDNFASIVAGVEEGRAVFENVRKFLTYILTHNVPELVPYLALVLFRVPLALPILQVLAIDLGTDIVPALALGAEPPEPDVMQRPPRPRHERLLRGSVLARVYFVLGLCESIAAMSAFFFVLRRGGWRYGQMLTSPHPLYSQATTACLTAIVLMQVVNIFLCRSERESIRSSGMLRNRLILWGIGTELLILLAIDYLPWGHMVFGTAPVAWRVWLFLLPFMGAMLLVEEGRKWLVRRLSQTAPATMRARCWSERLRRSPAVWEAVSRAEN